MNQSKLRQLLDRLCGLPENEWLEFKKAKKGYDFNKLGQYFSALSNEANLNGQACGWLVFGVSDDRSVCGSQFRKDPADLNSLKHEIANHTTGGLTFVDIYVVEHPNGRVVMFEIPAALQGIPTAWKGHWYGRNGESLGGLSLMELEKIRSNSSDGHQDWNRHEYAPDLAIANLLGSWNELNEADVEIVSQLIDDEDYAKWILKMREMLSQAISPVRYVNGKWYVDDRKELWQVLGKRVFDESLNALKQCAIAVLSECDPQFDLPPDERYTARISGKTLKYSSTLRKGLAETLALLGTAPDALINFSPQHRGWKPKDTADFVVREILENADWVLWGSLRGLLSTLAEAAPDKFLDAAENALQRSPCPFDALFAQEGAPITGSSYMSDLLWALETLAWDAEYLVRVCVILGKLASRDPGGPWANRPADSLSMILLPWLPQTIAPVEKRKVAIQTLCDELPEIAWNLIVSLLPGQNQITTGTRKPAWRNTIPVDWKEKVTRQDYRDQVAFCAERAVSIAGCDPDKLGELIDHLAGFPKPSFHALLETLASDSITALSEEKRLHLWDKLVKFISRHRRLSGEKGTRNDGSLAPIEAVANELAPKNPLNLYRRLFSRSIWDHSTKSEDWTKQLDRDRQQAIKEILACGGVELVLRFAEVVEAPWDVGRSLGAIAQVENDRRLLPALLETENDKLALFANNYVRSRQNIAGWKWVDGFDISNWSASQIGRFLAALPFTREAWHRATKWLGKSEEEYWSKTSANPYSTDEDLRFAIDKLIAHGRPHAAIKCLMCQMDLGKQPLDNALCVKALRAAISSYEPSHEVETHSIIAIVKALQDDPKTDPDALFQIEWAYLRLLDKYYHPDASPKTLKNRLASDPEFFCEVIRLVYRSKRETESPQQLDDRDKVIADNAYELLRNWQTPPGTQADGRFLPEQFEKWFKRTKEACVESGHLEVALRRIGEVLIHAPPDPKGLWIHRTLASALNTEDAGEMRDGFRVGIYNARGVHVVDPTGKPERELAEKYRQQAEEVENAGYHRFAITLRNLEKEYNREAEVYVAEHQRESARQLARLGGSEPQLQSIPRQRTDRA